MDYLFGNRPQISPEELKRQRESYDERKRLQAPDLPKPGNLRHVIALADDLKEQYPMLEVRVSSSYLDSEVYIAQGSIPLDGYVGGFYISRNVHNQREHDLLLEELALATGKQSSEAVQA